jgi:hypothetical protein
MAAQRVQQTARRARQAIEPRDDHDVAVVELGQEPHQLPAIRPGAANLLLINALGAGSLQLRFAPVETQCTPPPDFELVLVQDGPQQWINTANLTLLAELRRRATEAIDWIAMGDVVPLSTHSRPQEIAGPCAGIDWAAGGAMIAPRGRRRMYARPAGPVFTSPCRRACFFLARVFRAPYRGKPSTA